MSSAAPGRARSVERLLAALRGLGWVAVAAVLALGGAGLVGQLWHPAGGPDRAELTYLGDAVMTTVLDSSEAEVLDVAAEVDALADEARIALATVAASDLEALEASLGRGSVRASAIDVAVATLRERLRSLPGDEPDAALQYRNAVILRRAALLAAVEAADGLAGQWSAVRARSTDLAALLARIEDHDMTVLAAAAAGRERRYADAIVLLATAREILTEIHERRTKLVAGTETTVLDEWIERNLAYDVALTTLYDALLDSGGQNTVRVQSALREERIAREQLPPDNRAIVVIVSEVARGGLNQAVLAIEETRGRIDTALSEAEDEDPFATDTPDGGG